MDSIRSSSNPYSQHPPPNRARYPLDCPRIAHTASGAFLWLMTPYDRVKSIQGHLRANDGVGARITITVTSPKWCWESLALSQKNSLTRPRIVTTHTTGCVCRVVNHHPACRSTTKSRGTPIDAGNSRGTGVSIMYIVTSCNNRHGAGGVAFVGAEKRGSGKVAKQKLSSWPLQLSRSRTFTPPSPPTPPMFPHGNLPS